MKDAKNRFRTHTGVRISGLILTIFVPIHVLAISSIIISEGAYAFVMRTLKLGFLSADGQGFTWMVPVLVLSLAMVAAVHIVLVIRKRADLGTAHSLPNLRKAQTVTGLLILLLLPVHLWWIGSAPESFDPQSSAQRVWSGLNWLFYLALLVLVVMHGAQGVYRILSENEDKKTHSHRQRTQRILYIASALLILTGAFALYAMSYVDIVY